MTNKKEETMEEEVKKVIELDDAELEEICGGSQNSRNTYDEPNTYCAEVC